MKSNKFTALEIRTLTPAATTVSDVFRAMELHFLKEGLIVCRFSINGMALTEEDEKRLAPSEATSIQLLDVETQTPASILNDVLANWLDTLPKVIKKVDRIAADIRFKGMDSFTGFIEVIDSCQCLIDSLISLRSLCKDEIAEQGPAWDKTEQLTLKAIAESLNAFEKKDLGALADVLEYDIAHSLQSWLETLLGLRDHLKRNERADVDSIL